MQTLTHGRARTKTLGRWVLGAFLLSWLCGSANACMPAAEAAQQPMAGAEHTSHAMHATHAAQADARPAHCAHCADGAMQDCASLSSGSLDDCRQAVDAWHDGRQPEPNTKAKPLDTACAAPPQPPPGMADRATRPPVSRVVSDPPSGPSLNVLYCVYLK